MKGRGRPRARGASRLIKRYENRKLYDTEARRYVTLDDLAAIVARGDEIHVVDQRSGEDLTTLVFAQVILEGIRQRTARIPRQVLARLIRLGSLRDVPWPEWSGPHEAADRARREVERTVAGLLTKGRLSLEEALSLKQDLAQSVHRIVSDAQKGLEGRLHRLLEAEPGVSPALQALKQHLLAFETYLGPRATKTRRGSGPKTPARRG